MARVVGVLLSAWLVGCGGATRGHAETGDPSNPARDAGVVVDASTDVADSGVPSSDGASDADAATVVDPTERSGSRVKVVVWTAADGTPLWRNKLHDAEKDVDCRVQRADDDTFRCLPDGEGAGTVVYADGNCTQPVVYAGESTDDCNPPPGGRYTTYRSQQACPSERSLVVTRGAAIAPPSQEFIGGGPGICYSNGTSASRAYYEVAPAPAGEWTRFTRSIFPVTSALGIEVFTGEDGSVVDGSLWLLSEDEACEPLDPGLYTEPTRCVPVNRSTYRGDATYSDGACTTSVVSSPFCRPPSLIQDPLPGTGCHATPQFLARGQSVPNREIRWTVHGTCEPATPSWLDGLSFYLPGAPIPLDRYPEISMSSSGDGALRRMAWTSEGKELSTLPGSAMVQTAGAPSTSLCNPVRLAGGPTACVVDGGQPGYLYADADCTEPLLLRVQPDPCAIAPAVEDIVVIDEVDPCGRARRVRAIAGEYTGTVYDLGDICRPLPPDASGGYHYFRLGPPQDAASVLLLLTAKTL